MNEIYIVILTISILFVIFAKRRFDYFSIAILSTAIYYYPLVYNRLYYYYTSISTDYIRADIKVYIAVVLYLLFCIVFAVLSDNVVVHIGNRSHTKRNITNNYIFENASDNKAVFILEIIGLLLMIYTVIRLGGFATSAEGKVSLLGLANRFTEYFKFITLFSFVYSFVNHGRYIFLMRIISVLLCLATFLLGHRSFIVIGLIAIFVHHVITSNKRYFFKYLLKYKKMIILMVLAAAFFLFIKDVGFYLIAGDLKTVIARLSSASYYGKAIFHSEANIITLNLHNSMTSPISYGIIDHLKQLLVTIPLLGSKIVDAMGFKAYDVLLNEKFNVKMDQGVGLGSTMLGEAYSPGSWFNFIIILLILFIVIYSLNMVLRQLKNGIGYTLCSVFLVYLTFYSHRNSLGILLVFLRAQIYIWLLVRIIKMVITGTSKFASNASQAKPKRGIRFRVGARTIRGLY